MRKDWKYIIYVAGAVALFVIVKLLSPKPYNWSVTLAHGDKNPYGTYALNQLLPTFFDDQKISHSYQTLYELKDSLKEKDNLLVIASSFNAEQEDTDALLDYVKNGGSAFIVAQNWWGKFADTLQISTADYFFSHDNNLSAKDTSYLKFANHGLDTTAQYGYRRDNIHNYFNKFDTTRTTVIAWNDDKNPVTIRMQWGKGYLILNSTPLVFTNIYLLSKENHNFISTTFSHLPKKDLQWTEFYQVGRMEASTPLRFILTNEPLRWAYYITLISILLFMLFEARRKQRVIPIINQLANTTLEFVSTIGNLYYHKGDHKNIAEKKINFLLEQIRAKYLLPTHELNENFIKSLTRKSGHAEEDIRALVKTISFILSSTVISVEQLMDLNRKIENFNNH